MAAPPFKVKAVYEYASEHDDDLTFPIGQIISVTELEGDDWYVGEYTDVAGAKHEGLFPTNFVEKYEPEVPTRPSRPRPKQETQQQPGPALAPEEEEAPTVPAASKPQAPPVDIPPAASKVEEARSPPSAISQKSPMASAESPPAPKPAQAEPAEPVPTPSKKAPPPVAAKSNAFKDRIAAFNQPAAAPIAPMPGGRQQQPTGFIKKPFVAPPPSKSAYVPPTKAEPVHKPYVREEDPEIRQREEEDRAAAEAAGFTNDSAPPATQGEEEDEDAPKPMTLKERMALLQKQQQEQAQRRAETTQKKEKKTPQKKASESSDYAGVGEGEGEDLERVRSDATERRSVDAPRDKPRVPSAHRRPPEPTSPVPAMPDHEMVSDGHEADQSGAGDLTEEDDADTLGPGKDDGDERRIEALRHPVAPRQEPDVGDEEDTTDGDGEDEEEEVDEETKRKEELRARMARLGGGMPGMGAPFNPFGAPPAPPRKKTSTKERKASEETAPTSPPQQMAPVVPVPGMQRMQSPDSDTTQRVGTREDPEPEEESEDDEPPPPPQRTSTMERGAPPPVPKGKLSRPKDYSRSKKLVLHGQLDSATGPEQRPSTCLDGMAEVRVRRRARRRLLPPMSRIISSIYCTSISPRTSLTLP